MYLSSDFPLASPPKYRKFSKRRFRQKEVEELREAGRKIQEQLPKHNERNAGRKKTDEKWIKSYLQWVALYESQKPVKETMKIMGISKATYYRFKKVYNERE